MSTTADPTTTAPRAITIADIERRITALLTTPSTTRIYGEVREALISDIKEFAADAASQAVITSREVDRQVSGDIARQAVLDELTATMPLSARDAYVAAHAALLRWRVRAEAHRAAKALLGEHKVAGNGLRVRCTAALVEGGMSQSAADKAASDHPDYKAHREREAELVWHEYVAEQAAKEAWESLQNAREFVRGYNAHVLND